LCEINHAQKKHCLKPRNRRGALCGSEVLHSCNNHYTTLTRQCRVIDHLSSSKQNNSLAHHVVVFNFIKKHFNKRAYFLNAC